MSDLLQTWLQLAPANEAKGDPGRVANVFYKIEGGKVVLYDARGDRYVDGDGQGYQRLVNSHEAPELTAQRLARIVHKKLTGDGAGAAFNRPIKYGDARIV